MRSARADLHIRNLIPKILAPNRRARVSVCVFTGNHAQIYGEDLKKIVIGGSSSSSNNNFFATKSEIFFFFVVCFLGFLFLFFPSSSLQIDCPEAMIPPRPSSVINKNTREREKQENKIRKAREEAKLFGCICRIQ